MLTPSPTRLHRFVTGSLILAAGSAFFTPARSDVIALAWRADEHFERAVQIAPSKFAELCGKLTRGQESTWQFAASGATDFSELLVKGSDQKEGLLHVPQRRTR